MTTSNKKVYKLRKDKIAFEYDDGGALEDLQKDFNNMTSKRGTALSPQTCKSYISKINRIAYMMTNKPYENYEFLKDADRVIKKIEDSDLKSKKDYLSAISKLLRHKNVNAIHIDKYVKAMTKEKELETKSRGNNIAKKEDIQKTNGKSLKDIQKLITDYSIMDNGKIDDEKLINKLLVSFYFMNFNTDGLPNFIPRNDLPEFKIISVNRTKKQLSPDFNYLVVNENKIPTKIIMKNYKTKSTYGTQSFKISNELATLVQKYLQEYGKANGDYLFVDRNSKPFKHNNFANIIENAMQNIIGSKIGIDLARQILLTNIYNDNPLMTINQKNEVGRAFLHNASMSQEYLRPDLVK